VESGLVYRSAFGYELAMRVLYGRAFSARYHAVAAFVPEGATVVDVCCGPPILYRRFLREKGVRYTGVDINERFVAQVRAAGGEAMRCDVASASALPPGEIVVMHASLYHFLPDAAPVVAKLYAAASKRVVIAEPVRNLVDGQNSIVAAIARRIARPPGGHAMHRFTEAALDACFEPYAKSVESSFLIPGGREKVYVLAK
jgi:SAM-dependent methyltransferase